MEAGGQCLVNPRQVPVAEELGDIGQFVAEACQVDADLAKLTLHAGRLPAAPAAGGDVAVRFFHRVVENAVVRLQFRELHVGQLHQVERFVQIVRLVDDDGGVPVDDDQIAVVVTEVLGGRLQRLLIRKPAGILLLGQQGGDGAAVGEEPFLGARGGAGAVGGLEGRVDAEDGIRFLVAQ